MTTVALAPEEIAFNPSSFCDRHGRVFTWQGDLYRALTAAGAALYRTLEAGGILERLIERGMLVPTERTKLSLEGYDLVVRHRRIQFVSLPEEWSPRMVRDAALLIADLELALQNEGLALNENDLAFENVLFDGCRPVFIDLSSIREQQNVRRGGYADFEGACTFPLRLMALGQARLARTLLAAENGRALEEWFESSRPTDQTPTFSRFLRRASRALLGAAPPGDHLRKLRKEVESISLPELPHPEPRSSGALTALLGELKPRTAMIIGPQGAPVLETLVASGCAVIFAAPDGRIVDREYDRSPGDRMFPVVLDLRYPSPARVVRNRELAPAAERLQCELLLADGAVERMVFEQYLHFDQIAASLAAFTQRHLLATFLPPEDATLREKQRDPYFDWYRLENFRQSLSRFFREVESRELPGQGRVLLVCKK